LKRIKILVGLLVALMVLGAVSVPTVSAQTHNLDGVWLKCKVATKGYSFIRATGEYGKASGSVEAYLHFVWNEPKYYYDVAVWTLLSPDKVWAHLFDTITLTIQPGEHFTEETHLRFWFSAADFLNTYHASFIDYKFKDGKLTKVTLKGAGEVVGGQVENGSKEYLGSFTISGTNVDVSKLPPGITP
jgi:hypothetical protein